MCSSELGLGASPSSHMDACVRKDMNAQAHTHFRGILYFPQPYPTCQRRLLNNSLWSSVCSYSSLSLKWKERLEYFLLHWNWYFLLHWNWFQFYIRLPLMQINSINFCFDIGDPMTPRDAWSLTQHLLASSANHTLPWLFFTSSAIPIMPSVLPQAIWLAGESLYILLFFGTNRLFIGVIPRISFVFVEHT